MVKVNQIISIVIIFFFLFLDANISFAQSQFSSVISKMETSLLGVDYNNEGDEQRVKRLEELVYGASYSSLPLKGRVEKLKVDLAADLYGQQITPKADTFAEDDTKFSEPVLKADSSVNYPIVNEMEVKILQKEFKNLEINKRLSNLEQKLFNKVYSDDLNSRVERLKLAVLPGPNPISDANEEYFTESGGAAFEGLENNFSEKGNYSSKTDSNLSEGLNSDISVPLSALEMSILKRAYADDDPENRLNRLESTLFSTNFSSDTPQSRIGRLKSACRAQRSSAKYDSNKFSQKMTTAMQLGAMLLMVLACIL